MKTKERGGGAWSDLQQVVVIRAPKWCPFFYLYILSIFERGVVRLGVSDARGG